MNTIQLETVSLACSQHGRGAPLILVHGSNSDYRSWEPVVASLAEQFRVIVYSRRWHWPNEPISEDVDYSMHQHVADLEGVIDALNTAPTHLVGHSYGALVCLLLAIRRPHLVRSLVLGKPILSSWQKLIDYCHVVMANEKREHFRVLFLNRKNQLIADEVQQIGTVDHAPVYPREIIRRALEVGATALILVHNHPSGDPTPSDSDLEMTEEIVRAARTMDVTVHDHIIIAKGGYASFKSLGLMDFS
jgi:pimeloyl-ACP methyl ester carboxylesterase